MKSFAEFTSLKYNCTDKSYKTVGVVLVKEKEIVSIEEDLGNVEGKPNSTMTTISIKNGDTFLVKETAKQVANILWLNNE